LAKVRCAFAGEFCRVLGSSLLRAEPLFVVFGIVVLLVELLKLGTAKATPPRSASTYR
jgi:hypothetical protein